MAAAVTYMVTVFLWERWCAILNNSELQEDNMPITVPSPKECEFNAETKVPEETFMPVQNLDSVWVTQLGERFHTGSLCPGLKEARRGSLTERTLCQYCRREGSMM